MSQLKQAGSFVVGKDGKLAENLKDEAMKSRRQNSEFRIQNSEKEKTKLKKTEEKKETEN